MPEGLLPTVTLALTMASKRMSRKNALIKNLESVETLGSTTVICTDKTGTLTQNRLGVVSLVVGGREYSNADAALRSDLGLPVALDAMALCNNAELVEDGFSGDATDGALLLFAAERGDIAMLRDVQKIAEQPFDYAARRMATVVESDRHDGPQAYLKGAPEVVLGLCDRILIDGKPRANGRCAPGNGEPGLSAARGRGERGLGLALAQRG